VDGEISESGKKKLRIQKSGLGLKGTTSASEIIDDA